MPENRGIEVSLQSQYDALSLPEFAAPNVPPRPSLQHESGLSLEPSQARGDSTVVEAYAPIYPGSQFWIMFRCLEPIEPEVRYYYFKLCIRGKDILSWGCGEKDEWGGRVGFGLFAGDDNDDRGGPVIEKRAFIYPNLDEVGGGGSFEIRVYRAKARRREQKALERWDDGVGEGDMKVSLAGYLKPHEPRRMYAYALLDPTEKPYASFLYHHHTSHQLRQLGLNLPPGFDAGGITKASPSKRVQTLFEPLSPPPKSKPSSPPTSEYTGKDSIALRHLSMPPRLRFNEAQIEHGSPVKRQQEQTSFDSLEGLSLARPMVDTGNPKARSASPVQKQLLELSIPRSTSSSGLLKGMAGRWKRRVNSKDERNLSLPEGSLAERWNY